MTTQFLISKVEDVFGINIDEIQSNSRLREATDARKAIVYFLRKYFNIGSNNIATEIKRKHCTIIWYFREAEYLIK